MQVVKVTRAITDQVGCELRWSAMALSPLQPPQRLALMFELNQAVDDARLLQVGV